MAAAGSSGIRLFTRSSNSISSLGPNIQVVSDAQMKDSKNNLTLVNATITSSDQRMLQGILRVKIGGSWGVVCDNQFDLVAARIACTELGLVAHPGVRLLQLSVLEV